MYQSLNKKTKIVRNLILSAIMILLIPTLALAAKPANKGISQSYEDFNSQKNALFKMDINKKNIQQIVEETLSKLQKNYDKVKDLESQQKKQELSPEGNEMAFDLETLQVLKILAKESINKEDCSKARHEHELNFPIFEDEQAQAISNIINKVCASY